jgi:hypothetical protein
MGDGHTYVFTHSDHHLAPPRANEDTRWPGRVWRTSSHLTLTEAHPGRRHHVLAHVFRAAISLCYLNDNLSYLNDTLLSSAVLSCSCSSFYFLLYLWPQAYGQGPHSFHFRLSLPMLFYRAKLLLLLPLRGGGVSHRDLRPCVARTPLASGTITCALSVETNSFVRGAFVEAGTFLPSFVGKVSRAHRDRLRAYRWL